MNLNCSRSRIEPPLRLADRHWFFARIVWPSVNMKSQNYNATFGCAGFLDNAMPLARTIAGWITSQSTGAPFRDDALHHFFRARAPELNFDGVFFSNAAASALMSSTASEV